MCVNWKKAAALGLAVLIGSMVPATGMLAAEEDAGSAPAPEISIKWNGRDLTCEPGGTITYEYINYNVMAFQFDVYAEHAASVSFYMDTVTDTDQAAKGIEDLKGTSIQWAAVSSGNYIKLPADGTYVLYVKAEGENGQTGYARSGGIVGDTQAPKVIGLEEGKTYQEGTEFRIEDPYLESVTINEQPVAIAADGTYKVAANGTSCIIKAEDKAGNKTCLNITVTGGSEPPTPDSDVISESRAYELQAGVKYHLAAGKWKVNGDRSIYMGNNDFYVPADGTYTFTK